MITYEGRGTHYLVFDKDLNMHFVVGKSDKIEIPDDLYKTLKERGHMAEGKLADAQPAQVTKESLDKLRFGEIS